ncbi:MAG: nucleotidyltransferase family protein [Oscillospiraceae bacterium]|nr:nucleotidyltransferase family protein [Oscillospiraceae bacterium]
MKIVGVICEYNPFHLGHEKQFDRIRKEFGEDTAIVCLMSGNFVQRGYPAIFHKSLRAAAAIECGADLVLELPPVFALCSAEGFAAGGVNILSKFCDYLCFGAETGTAESLMAAAEALLRPEFSDTLGAELSTGVSFAAARQRALEAMDIDASLLENPNDILGLEYCKAILARNCAMRPLVINRKGNYHAAEPEPENPSATSLRKLLQNGKAWRDYVPAEAAAIFESAPIYTLAAGERSVLARLRTMTNADFEALPFGSEGLWRKFMRSSRNCATLEEILTATKSKRYARSRLDRMVMCAFLGLTLDEMQNKPPYVRVLGFNETGTSVLKIARQTGDFPHIGEKTGQAYEALEQRLEDLYGLFRVGTPAAPNSKLRVYIKKATE